MKPDTVQVGHVEQCNQAGQFWQIAQVGASTRCRNAGFTMRCRNVGFTILEVISVLVILAVLTLGGVSSLHQSEISLYVERDELVSRLLYARGLGMAQGGGICLNLRNAGGRHIQFLTRIRFAAVVRTRSARHEAGVTADGTGQDDAVSLSYPGEITPHIMLAGLSVTADMECFCFDTFGRLCQPEALYAAQPGGVLTCTDMADSSTITLAAGGASQCVTIFNETGMIR